MLINMQHHQNKYKHVYTGIATSTSKRLHKDCRAAHIKPESSYCGTNSLYDIPWIGFHSFSNTLVPTLSNFTEIPLLPHSVERSCNMRANSYLLWRLTLQLSHVHELMRRTFFLSDFKEDLQLMYMNDICYKPWFVGVQDNIITRWYHCIRLLHAV